MEPEGQALQANAPHGHCRPLAFLSALRCDRLPAPRVFDGPIDELRFRAYLDQVLEPTLEPGHVVVMDNLGSHKSVEVRRMIRAAGAWRWHLPPYSPDLNPIEKAFAKIKHWMRTGQKRTIGETWRHVGHLATATKPNDCANYFQSAGYASAKT